MDRTACTEPQCLYKGDLYLYLFLKMGRNGVFGIETGPWVVVYVSGSMVPVLAGARGLDVIQNVQAGSGAQARTLKRAAGLRPYKSKLKKNTNYVDTGKSNCYVIYPAAKISH
jgi:hypothetical protein